MRSSRAAVRELHVRSALNPMLWLTGIVTPLGIGGAWLFRGQPTVLMMLVALATLPVIVTCIGFTYFAFTNPEKLQSEDYQLRHESLQMMQTQTGSTTIDVSAITAITNPALPTLQLPPSTGGGAE